MYGARPKRIFRKAATKFLLENQHKRSIQSDAKQLTMLDKYIDARKPYPLNWEEQKRLFNMLPAHLRQMALFAVNTGCHDQEICSLRWEWEVKIPELKTLVFIIPGKIVKNRD